jgi:hypothetical protein
MKSAESRLERVLSAEPRPVQAIVGTCADVQGNGERGRAAVRVRIRVVGGLESEHVRE